MAESSQNGWKHCGKRRNGSLQAISLFPTVFSKDFVLQTRKNQGLFRKELTHSQMTNFRLFQTERVAEDNFRFDENGRKSTKLVEKTVTSNFSFSHSVFKRPVSQGRQKVSLCGNGLRYQM